MLKELIKRILFKPKQPKIPKAKPIHNERELQDVIEDRYKAVEHLVNCSIVYPDAMCRFEGIAFQGVSFNIEKELNIKLTFELEESFIIYFNQKEN